MAEPPPQLASDLVAAVPLLADALEGRRIRYAVIGGIATMLRGRPRFTQDVDVLLDVPQLQLPGLLDDLVGSGFALDHATVIREFVREHFTAFRFGAVRIDWLKPVLPLYVRALADATTVNWPEGTRLRVASPEGLILTKMVAFRPQDQVDIETLLAANRDDVDLAVILREWGEVAEGEDARTSWLEGAIARLVPRR